MARAKSGIPTFHQFIQRKSWTPVPAFVVLAGDARFFRKEVERRALAAIFGDEKTPEVHRYHLGKNSGASKNLDSMLATVLDELRTLSILSPNRAVVIDGADSFVDAFRDDLEPFVQEGFSGGHLILHLEKKLDARTKFARAVKESAWVMDCSKPFDRPPPWKAGGPPWQNELSEWIVGWARETRKLDISLQDAFYLQERIGNDLDALDKSLEKLHLLLGDKRKIDAETIASVTGETRDDSIFSLVEYFIARDRNRALRIVERLFTSGYHPPQGSAVNEPVAITSLFIGSVVPRLRKIRRAHAVSDSGGGPDRWMELGLTSRPFIDRFSREVRAMPPRRIQLAFDAMLKMDRQIKTGANARTLMALFLSKV